MYYYVINYCKGHYSIDGSYKQQDSADRRAERIEGGETHVFASLSPDVETALEEFKDEQVRRIR